MVLLTRALFPACKIPLNGIQCSHIWWPGWSYKWSPLPYPPHLIICIQTVDNSVILFEEKYLLNKASINSPRSPRNMSTALITCGLQRHANNSTPYIHHQSVLKLTLHYLIWTVIPWRVSCTGDISRWSWALSTNKM
jgi:hypothetical protein